MREEKGTYGRAGVWMSSRMVTTLRIHIMVNVGTDLINQSNDNDQ